MEWEIIFSYVLLNVCHIEECLLWKVYIVIKSISYVMQTCTVQGIQKNMQQFETHGTMEWLVAKVKGGTTGCGNIRSLLLSKRHRLYLIAYSVEELCLLSKHFTKSVVLWQYKDSFPGNSTWDRHQQDHSVTHLVLMFTTAMWFCLYFLNFLGFSRYI
jgi:hypothetical protein